MSDFGSIYSFRKSGLYKKGPMDPGGQVNNSYQDPTYLSFTLLFVTGDNNDSPFLSGAAEDFLAKLKTGSNIQKYQTRLQNLKDFKAALLAINTQMPWYWQSLDGVERLVQYDVNRVYWGGDDAKLKIGCLESINMAITGLMALYRKAVWDEEKWSYLLPANLRKFSMFVYIGDVRTLDDNAYEGTKVLDSSNDTDPANLDLISHKPTALFKLQFCEFDIMSGSKAFEGLKADVPEITSQEIAITYEYLKQVDGVYLNGVLNMTTDATAQTTVNTPGVQAFTTNNNSTVIGNLKKQFSPSGLQASANQLKQQATNDLATLSAAKKQEITGAVTGTIGNLVPTPENVLMNGVNAIDQATRINPAQLENAILGNVYGANVGQTIISALNRGALNGLNLGNVFH